MAYVLVALALFIPGGLIIRGLVEGEFHTEVDEDLLRRKEAIRNRLADIAAISPVGPQLAVVEVPVLPEILPAFGDTLGYDSLEGEAIRYRQYVYHATAEGRNYRVQIRQSLLESDDLIDNISLSLGLLLALLLSGLLLVNLSVSRYLWRPFQRTLEAVEGFDWSKPGALVLPATGTREFAQLNRVLERMGGRIQDHFANLKEFTENASHELQTPLAILLAKLENLADSRDLTEDQAAEVQAMQSAAGRLSRMNRALLLLSRLEGRQYLEKSRVDLGAEAERILGEYAELIEMKGLAVEIQVTGRLLVVMNPDLAAILVSNLVRNAIQHNVPGGRIEVAIAADSFSIRNTGPVPPGDPENLFDRFKKANQASESLGLGLAIAKRICDLSGYGLSYRYRDSRHILTVAV